MSRTKLTQNSIAAGAINANTMFAADVVGPHAIANTSTYSVSELLVGGTILLDNTGNIQINNGGTIGSTGDADAITIASNGVVTMNQIPVLSAGLNVSGGTIAGTLSTAAQGNITSLGTLTGLSVSSTGNVIPSIITASGNAVGLQLHQSGATRWELGAGVGDGSGNFNLYSSLSGTTGIRLAVTNAGNVGIGTAAPANLLNIVNASGQTDAVGNMQIAYSGSAGVNSGLTVKNYHGTSQFMQWETYGLRIGSRILTNSGVGDIIFTTGSDSEKVRIKADGNVGIGTTPTIDSALAGLSIAGTVLHVNNTSGASLKLTDPATGANRGLGVALIGVESAIVNCEAGDMRFGTGNQERMRLDHSSTALAIGTTAAAAGSALHVHGLMHQTTLATGTTVHGYLAMEDMTSSSNYNTAYGWHALMNVTGGTHNVALGYQTMVSNVAGGHYNIAIGSNCAEALTDADYNISIGYYTGNELTSGGQNVYMGGFAGRYYVTPANNTFIGYAAGGGHSSSKGTGAQCTAIGSYAFMAATTHTSGTFLGHNAGQLVTTGSGATYLGYYAGKSAIGAVVNSTMVGTVCGHYMQGGYNTGVGANALVGHSTTPANNTGTYNTALGYAAMQNDTNSATGITSHHTVAIGAHAADSLTSGGQNVIIGHNAAGFITTSASNCIIGFQAALEMRGGSANNALGRNCMHNMNTGTHNQAIGYTAMYGRAYASGGITGSHNIAMGHNSLYYLESASHNTAIGYAGMHRATTGAQNTIVGSHAGQWIRTGSNNVHIGMYTGGTSDVGTSAAHAIMIGYGAKPSGNTSHELVLGTNSETGKGNSTGFISPASGGVYQGNNSSAWSTTSDRRIKKNIIDNNIGLDAINQIRVRNFEYRQRDEIIELSPDSAINKKGMQLGVIAQEIQPILPDIVKEESTGCLSVNPDNMTWYLVNAVKELSAKVDELTTELEELKNA